jgi:hypothetical protein
LGFPFSIQSRVSARQGVERHPARPTAVSPSAIECAFLTQHLIKRFEGIVLMLQYYSLHQKSCRGRESDRDEFTRPHTRYSKCRKNELQQATFTAAGPSEAAFSPAPFLVSQNSQATFELCDLCHGKWHRFIKNLSPEDRSRPYLMFLRWLMASQG